MQFLEAELKNPVMNASGTIGLQSERTVNLSTFGALVSKGVTPLPRSGNPAPRIWENPSGMGNSIGLENSGIEVFIEEELQCWLEFGPPVIVNISGSTPEEYAEMAKALDKTDIWAIEANISCPNREGVIFGTDASLAYDVVSKIKKATSKKVTAKLTPNVTDISLICRAVLHAGVDCVSLVNTYFGMRINPETGKPRLGKVFGGASGPGIMPLALYQVFRAREVLGENFPIIGMGGISSPDDACEFFWAGASAVAVGTANFVNFQAIPQITQGLHSCFKKRRLAEKCPWLEYLKDWVEEESEEDEEE